MPPTDTETIFSKIIRREIPADIVFQDDRVTVFKDINPQAPTHLLIIPNTPVAKHSDVDDPQVYADVMTAARNVAKQLGLADYRLVINNGAGAGQTVFHLHVHLLSGRSLQWPPG